MIFKYITKNLQGICTFFNIHINFLIILKKIMYWDNYKHYLEQFTKDFTQKFIHIKKLFLGKKTCNPYLK